MIISIKKYKQRPIVYNSNYKITFGELASSVLMSPESFRDSQNENFFNFSEVSNSPPGLSQRQVEDKTIYKRGVLMS